MHSLDIRRAAEAAAGDLEHCALAELCAVAVCPAYACRAEQVAVGIGDQAALRSGTGDKDFLDLVETAHLTFKGAADGEIAFGVISLPRELRGRRAVAGAVANIEEALQCAKDNPSTTGGRVVLKASYAIAPDFFNSLLGADRVEAENPKMAYGFSCRTHRCFGAMSTLPAPRLL